MEERFNFYTSKQCSIFNYLKITKLENVIRGFTIILCPFITLIPNMSDGFETDVFEVTKVQATLFP